MSKNNSSQAGRKRMNGNDSPVITDRAKLRRLQDLVTELIDEHKISGNNLAKWTIGERRQGYISDIRKGKHLTTPPHIRPRESDYEAINRFRAFVVQQSGISSELVEMFLERFGLLGQVADLDRRIFLKLKQLALQEKAKTK